MAIAFVSKGSQTFTDGGNTIAPSLASVTAGNQVFLIVANSNGESSATPMTNPAGWNAEIVTNGIGALGYRPSVGIWSKYNSAGGSESGTTTIGTIGGSYAAGGVVQFSGLLTAAAADLSTSGSATGATSGNTGTTGTTSQADELILVVGHAEDAVGATSSFSSPASSGFTSLWTTSSNAAHIAWDASYKIVAATGTQTGSYTWVTSSAFSGAIVTLKASGGGGGPTVKPEYYYRGLRVA